MKSQNKYFEVIDFLKENSKGVIFLVVMGSIIYLLYQFRYNSRMHLSDKYHCVEVYVGGVKLKLHNNIDKELKNEI